MSITAFGIVGLGRMGGGLAGLALGKSYGVTGFSVGGAPKELLDAGLVELATIAGFRDALQHPRVIMLYIPAGPEVDTLIDELSEALEPGDIIIDGGNSYWGDSIRRHDRTQSQGDRVCRSRHLGWRVGCPRRGLFHGRRRRVRHQ